MKTRTLYRPVGMKELERIAALDWRGFPPRLSWQPIFYPVLNQAYAEQIAEDWNTEDSFSGYCGVVTRFDVDALYLEQYAVHHVGGDGHDELWIPAEELETFNRHITGRIEVVKVFTGSQFVLPEDQALKQYF
ncbi:ADP-ribosylation/crystallin J1 [Taibaiella koreensis]|uniref:ADP-ribosylation/crystallin J1 n=1 Tax=Taibaiella koreensis TaxID=1268548 RepID=UPI000E5992EC|nr:ADP-ribosylation/crystallin J1 [Taibaiella koreensis]